MNELLKDAFCRPDLTADSRRIEYIDLAKGICISLIIFLHLSIRIPLMDPTMVPLFFLLSGLFFKNSGVVASVIKKVNALLIPFLFFNIIGEVYFYFESKYLSTIEPHFEWLKTLLFMKANGPVWFLEALFWDFVIFMAIIRLCRRLWLQILSVVALAIAGLYLQQISEMFYISSALMALPFFALGYFIRNVEFVKVTKYDRYYFLVSILLFALMWALQTFLVDEDKFVVLTLQGGHIHLHNTDVISWPMLNAYVISLLGVFGMLALCKSIKWLPLFSYFGQYSLIVLCTHIFAVNVCEHVRQKFFGDGLLPMVVSIILVFAFSLIMIPICKKYIPHFVAQKNLIKIKR